ncbi:MAG: uracil-DNA glycosylase [Rickettsiales bacterium]|jgi:DNA polymerase|nr:uracil-DNA glycosylase [Rickettsiales bacterium]
MAVRIFAKEAAVYEALETARAKCENCAKCPLCKTKTKTVFSDGAPNGKLMLIGEAPGFYEDQEGKPFVGKSGQLLDRIFASVGLSRGEHVYICNTVKCRPPDNRNPLPEEKAACREYLDIQMDTLRPRIILLCGSVAAASLMDEPRGITKIRGQWFDGPFGSRMMPIFHPSYLLRNESREPGGPKWLTWRDIQEVRREYDKLI